MSMSAWLLVRLGLRGPAPAADGVPLRLGGGIFRMGGIFPASVAPVTDCAVL